MRYCLPVIALAALVASAGCQPAPATKKKTTSATTAASSAASDTATADDAKKADPAPQPPASDTVPSDNATSDAAPAANPSTNTSDDMPVQKTSFGKTSDGIEVDLYTIKNQNGLVLQMTNYGATVVSLETPDKDGKLANIQLSFPKLEGYLQRHPYFGSTVGRYGNRIAGGKFKIGDEEYTLAQNNGPNHLHGGKQGFDAVVWDAAEVSDASGTGVKFTYFSKDGEEGYPGNLHITVTYTLTNQDELKIDYEATTDQATVLNPTNHCYWNLGGAGSGDILKTQLMIAAEHYLPIDETSIPTGELAPVEGTPMDFRKPTAIGDRIDELKKEPHTTKGYDHCYVLGKPGELKLAARAEDKTSGRVMEIHTTEPGIQLYCGNFLDGSESNGGFKQHEAFCLETQHYPDSPNQPEFPSTLLEPGQTFKSQTIHKFSVAK